MVLLLLPRSWRLRLLSKLPDTMTVYPFEAYVAAAAMLSGLPVVFGLPITSSVDQVLPQAFYVAWAGGLLAAGVTLGAGLAFHSFSGLILSGLRLLGTVCVVYGVAVLLHAGRFGFFPAVMVLVMGLLCWTRALYLQTVTEIVNEIRQYVDRDDDAP